ncbi:MAG: FtsH protease activity modulator HflK [Alphaproteobacteria bacterium]|nr:FtsH protease activity modulator HflK [Alphaproteobacteria bacterium]
MPWTSQGGGGGSPWGGGGGSGGGGRGQGPWGPGGPGGRPPDLEDLMRRGQDKLRGIMPGGIGSSRGIILILLLAIVVWGASGFYRVQPDEQGVVLQFGKWVRTTQPGLNYHLPAPVESVLTPKVTRVNREDIGFRSAGVTGAGARIVPEESLMLTGDENIVEVQFTVFWVIKDAGKFLFNIRNPAQTVKAAAESAMREVVGRSAIQKPGEQTSSSVAKKVASGALIQDILEKGRRDVEQESVKLLQRILDDYGAGIQITQVQMQKVDPPGQVIDAFRDVQRAEADKERLRNEAEAYRNDILPRARGEAAQLVQQAEAYKRQVVAKAQGETSRFRAIYDEYRKAPEVTRQRLYLETMQEVVKSNPPTIIDLKSGVIPYLPLPELQKQQKGGAR